MLFVHHDIKNGPLQFLNLYGLKDLPCNYAPSIFWSVRPWLLKIIFCFPLLYMTVLLSVL